MRAQDYHSSGVPGATATPAPPRQVTGTGAVARILALQRSIGNTAVCHLMSHAGHTVPAETAIPVQRADPAQPGPDPSPPLLAWRNETTDLRTGNTLDLAIIWVDTSGVELNQLANALIEHQRGLVVLSRSDDHFINAATGAGFGVAYPDVGAYARLTGQGFTSSGLRWRISGPEVSSLPVADETFHREAAGQYAVSFAVAQHRSATTAVPASTSSNSLTGALGYPPPSHSGPAPAGPSTTLGSAIGPSTAPAPTIGGTTTSQAVVAAPAAAAAVAPQTTIPTTVSYNGLTVDTASGRVTSNGQLYPRELANAVARDLATLLRNENGNHPTSVGYYNLSKLRQFFTANHLGAAIRPAGYAGQYRLYHNGPSRPEVTWQGMTLNMASGTLSFPGSNGPRSLAAPQSQIITDTRVLAMARLLRAQGGVTAVARVHVGFLNSALAGSGWKIETLTGHTGRLVPVG